MKKFLLIVFSLSLFGSMRADEGMWLPLFLKKNEADMQAKGLKISTDDIYSVNQSSLKDAVVIFGGGCTGEFVSEQGLLLTNHHCGFGEIQSHSTLEHDYLRKGFWAQSLKEELPCPGLEIRLLIRMEEVTNQVLEGVSDNMTEKERKEQISKNIDKIRQANTTDENKNLLGNYEVMVYPFYYGNQYFMYINQIFTDVRLVGAPPSNIGKFGGDTDNWMWPRHTGDFSLFRVYVDANNLPAKYSEDNKPYIPKRAFQISIKGIEEGDFTFVFGYPGRTQEYLTSDAIRVVTETENPIRIEARTQRLNIINQAMNSDPLLRIQYAAKAAGVSNGWKKWQGENIGIARMDGIARKQAFEKDFQNWANTEASGKYKNVLPELKKAYADQESFLAQSAYYSEHVMAPDIVRFVGSYRKLVEKSNDPNAKAEDISQLAQNLQKNIPDFFKDFNKNVDQKIFEKLAVIGETKDGNPIRLIDFPGKDFNKTVDQFYTKSIFVNQEALSNLLENYHAKDVKKLEKDALYEYAQIANNLYRQTIQPMIASANARIDSLQRVYMAGQMSMQSDKMFYPDANFTLRVAYGNVAGYTPRDAVKYKHYTTLKGIMEKENPDIYDYVVEAKLKQLYNAKDYGRYAMKNGEMPVAFIATNHTTGGNSGSPVLDANGNLIGINFDRAWEGTMSDLMFDPSQCRNITLDVRYCLFIIEKFAGAQRLVDEMKIVE